MHIVNTHRKAWKLASERNLRFSFVGRYGSPVWFVGTREQLEAIGVDPTNIWEAIV
jgi:hypothetical protein